MSDIEFRGISKRFGGVVALEDVSLKINDNEYVALLGPSGCGKTTLLKVLAGIHAPTEGRVFVDEVDITDLPPEERGMGFVFQDYALFPHMDVLGNTTYGPLIRGEEYDKTLKTAHDMLKLVRLSARYDALPSELSGGMKQRVAVARALTTGSEVLLLDEPLSALDAKVRKELRLEMRRMVKDLKLTAIHVTHDQEEAMAICDKIVVMKKGRIEQVGTPREVYEHPRTLFVAGFIGEANFFRVKLTRAGGGFSSTTLLGKSIRVPCGQRDGIYIAAIRPEKIHIKEGKGAKIKSKRLLGAYIRYELERGDESFVAQDVHEFDGSVGIEFDEDDVRIFETPKESLREVLEVD